MKERKAFLLRMDPALYQALETWAQQDLRSLNGQIEFVLKEAVARRRKADDDQKSRVDENREPDDTQA